MQAEGVDASYLRQASDGAHQHDRRPGSTPAVSGALRIPRCAETTGSSRVSGATRPLRPQPDDVAGRLPTAAETGGRSGGGPARIRETGCGTALDSAGDGGDLHSHWIACCRTWTLYCPSYAEASHQTGQTDPPRILETYRQCGRRAGWGSSWVRTGRPAQSGAGCSCSDSPGCTTGTGRRHHRSRRCVLCRSIGRAAVRPGRGHSGPNGRGGRGLLRYGPGRHRGTAGFPGHRDPGRMGPRPGPRWLGTSEVSVPPAAGGRGRLISGAGSWYASVAFGTCGGRPTQYT